MPLVAKMRILWLIVLPISTGLAVTINVPDDYSTIQAGINVSNEGDTVLVAQGTYVENIILEKEIVLASHAINDNLDDWLNNENIQNTIILGNQPTDSRKGSCIQVSFENIEPTILGFTIKEGLGTSMIETDCAAFPIRSGGAIMIYEAYPIIMYNRFLNNGGGENNGGSVAVSNGGAISFFDTDDVEFDEDRNSYRQDTNLNSAHIESAWPYISENERNSSETIICDIPTTLIVRNNYFEENSSGNGESFYSHGYEGDIDVSGSVFEDINCETNTVNDFILRSKKNAAEFIQENISGNCIESNVYYVSSRFGDDINDGTEEAPFKTIGHALTLVRDSEIHTALYLDSGVYSPSINDEKFPIVPPDNVHLIGEGSENTILDAESSAENEVAVMIIKVVENVRIANLTLTGGFSASYGCTGGGGIQVSYDGLPVDATDEWRALTYPLIENVILEENHSFNGGGISFYRVEGPVLNNVIIRNNSVANRGGGLFAFGSTITMTDVIITGNECELNGGGMMLAASTNGVYENMIITNNSSGTHGGGIWTSYAGGPESYNEGWTMINSIISGNTSERHGGGIALGWSHPTIINCTISENTANWGGGGIMGITSGFTLKESIISNNYSITGGGGIRASGPIYDGLEPPIIEDCIITGNQTAGESGGMMLYNGDVKRTVVSENQAATFTGAIGIEGFATLTNLTIVGNTASQGGGVGVLDNANPQVINSIVWDNTPTAVSLSDSGQIDITFSDIDGGWVGEGNIDTDPYFTNPENGDFTLSYVSSCIDAGTADTDGDGENDITAYNGISPDMGAYETMNIAAPTGFTLYLSETYVTLTWDSTTQDGFQYYLLERSTDEEFTEENSVGNYLMINYYEDSSLEYDTEYFYRVSYFANQWSEYSDILSFTLETMNLDGDQTPEVYALHQNYPNPFNPVTNLSYDLLDGTMVNITIYDIMGRIVNNLVNVHQSSGYKSVQWNATNNQGEPVSAGVYLYKIQADDFVDTKKMILLK